MYNATQVKGIFQIQANLVSALRNDDFDEFCTATSVGIAYLDADAMVPLLSSLRAIIDPELVPRLIDYMMRRRTEDPQP